MTEHTPAARRAHTVVDSPVGPLTLVMAGGALTGLYLDAQRHAPPAESLGEFVAGPGSGGADACACDGDGDEFAEPARQLREYFAGQRTEFELPLAFEGTPFQRRVWAALREIPFGETVSYGELADRIGQPAAARAVGLANGRNPISIIVPCHRVIGASGDLTGYGGGIARKRQLLDFERQVSQVQSRPLPARS